MNEAELIFLGVKIWGGIGAIIAALFLTIGIDRFDEDAQGAYIFRPLLIPAIFLIWPLILWRWFIIETKRDKWPLRHKPPRKAHFIIALFLITLIPTIILTGFLVRPQWDTDFKPQRLEAPEQVFNQDHGGPHNER